MLIDTGNLRRNIIGAGLALALGGCSSFSLLYSFAGNYVIAQADTYLAPTEEEEAFIEKKTAELIKWHSTVMLPQYAQAFTNWADRVEAGPLERQSTTTVLKELRQLIDQVIEGGAPFGAAVLARHTSPDQMQTLRRVVAEKMAEKREEYEDRDNQIADRTETITDNFERITGTLDEAQRGKIKDYVVSSEANTADWLANRQKRQEAFLSFLDKRPDEAQIAKFIVQILLRPHEIVNPEYRKVSERRWAVIDQMMFDVMSTLTEAQRKETVRNLRDYAADMLAEAA
jgi:hypothetical protein